MPFSSGAFASSSAGQTSSVVKRLENSTSCQRSDFASPGAFTNWCQNCVRRSALPKAPSFSTHMALGRIRSAAWAETVG